MMHVRCKLEDCRRKIANTLKEENVQLFEKQGISLSLTLLSERGFPDKRKKVGPFCD